jgi:magnesium-transporting ATPase (P-type)
LLGLPILLRGYAFLGVLEALAAMAAFFFVLLLGGWNYGRELGWRDPLYLEATTACLCAIIVTQVCNVFLCRSERRSICSMNPGSNPLILYGIAVEVALILLVTYTAPGNALFGTAPIGLAVWLFTLPFAVLMLGLEELRKWLVRHHNPRPSLQGSDVSARLPGPGSMKEQACT